MSAVRIPLFLAMSMAMTLAVGLGGCALIGPVPPDETMAIRPLHKPPPPGRSLSQPAAMPKAVEPVARPSAQTERPPVTVPPAPPLVGLGQEEVRHVLGTPSAVREQPPAVIWAYETPDCRLALSFYMDMATEAFRVLTTEATPKGRNGLIGDACVGSIRTAGR